MDLQFSGKINECVYSIKEDVLYAYEQHRMTIHGLYGGRDYYTSSSGLSGKGKVYPRRTDLVRKLGSYMVNTRTLTPCPVGKVLVPVRAHTGIDLEYPFVYKTGVNSIRFLSRQELPLALLGSLEEVPYVVRPKEVYIQGQKKELVRHLCNPHKYHGVDLNRFLARKYIRGEDDVEISYRGVVLDRFLVKEGVLGVYDQWGDIVDVTDLPAPGGTPLGDWEWLDGGNIWTTTCNHTLVFICNWDTGETKTVPIQDWVKNEHG